MDAQMKKGVLEMCILFQLKNNKIYGYEIKKQIKKVFPEVLDSTIYTILRRLYAEGYTEIFIGNESNGPQRKYYSITPLGKEYLEKIIYEWKMINNAIFTLGIKI